MCDRETGIGVQSKPVLTNHNVIPEAREEVSMARRPRRRVWAVVKASPSATALVTASTPGPAARRSQGDATPAAIIRGAVQILMRLLVEINHRQRNA